MSDSKLKTENDPIIKFADTQSIKAALDNTETFRVTCPKGSQSLAAEWLEKEIESRSYTCRVITNNRAAALAAGLIPTGVTQVGAIAAGVAMGVHNLATWNPDYEICKDAIGSDIDVIFKK